MATKPYDVKKTYRFRLTVTVKMDGCRYSRADEHEATGALLNRIVEREGDVIDNAIAV